MTMQILTAHLLSTTALLTTLTHLVPARSEVATRG